MALAPPLTPAATSALIGAALTLAAAALGQAVARIPGWRDLRAFVAVALTGALAIACNAGNTLDLPARHYQVAGGLEFAFLLLHAAAWHRHLTVYAPLTPPRWARAVTWGTALLAPLAAVPGVLYRAQVTLRPVPWLGVVYHDARLTPAGAVLLALALTSGLLALVRAWAWWRSGAPGGGLHLLAASALFVLVGHDALATTGVPSPLPYLLDFGFAPILILQVFVLARRLAADGAELHALKEHLEHAVAARTAELERAHADLARSERLAALGRFSAQVAHQVNNPAAVIAANLRAIEAQVAGAPALHEAARESQEALRRIAALTHRLLDAGRAATAEPGALAPVPLAPAVREAIRLATARADRSGLALDVAVPEALAVLGERAGVVQLLTQLLVNALQAIPPERAGRVAVRAERRGARVELAVEDDGEGMTEDALRHVFEPFYSTRPEGTALGLGLAVARGLATAMGGTLRLESRRGTGTCARVELRAAEPAPAAAAAAPPEGGPARLRILVVDDDAAVRRALQRLLGRRHEVEGAAGVSDALARLAGATFDAVLCDLTMPEGGGEALLAAVRARWEALARRFVFVTGGATSAEARAFLDGLEQPVVEKPVDPEALERALAEVAPAPAEAPMARVDVLTS